MTSKVAVDYVTRNSHEHVFGNVAVMSFSIDMNGVDVAEFGDLLDLPQGAEILDAQMVTDGNGTATSDVELGIKSKNIAVGAHDDPNALITANGLDAAALLRKDTLFGPITLTDDKYILRLTVRVANNVLASVVTGFVMYRSGGTL